MKKILVLIIPFITLLASCVSSAQQQDLYTSASNSRATANAAMELAQYQEQFLTATAEAPIIRITETAAALVVQSTNAASTSQAGVTTQTASYVQTAAWWTPTPNATSTAAFAALNAENTQTSLDLERQQTSNDFWAIIPGVSIIFGLLGVVVLITLLVRDRRYRSVDVDPRGNPIPVLDLVHGTITDSDSNPNYRSHTMDDLLKRLFELYLQKKFGLDPELPQITDKRQDAVKERDQMIDLATRGLPGGESSADARGRKQLATQQAMKQLSDGNLAGRFMVLDSDPGANDQVIQVLDTEWKEAKNS